MTDISIAIRISVLGTALAVSTPILAQPALAAEQGMASWYGGEFNGQPAASGELYDQEQLTAAHRTLPFGTKVLVRRLDSPKSIVVRINDRGPYVESRIIDVSLAAARQLGMTESGLAPVSVEVLERPAVAEGAAAIASYFTVSAGCFRDPDNARHTLEAMQKGFGAARMVPVRDLACVQVGHMSTQSAARTLAGSVRRSGADFTAAAVVRVDPEAGAN